MTPGYRAIREGVALAGADHLHAVRVSGPAAFELLDRALGRDLFVQSGRMLHTLALRPDGTPLADVYACADDDAFVLLAEGPREALVEHLRACRPAGATADVEDLAPDRGLLTLTGPYAWELLSEVLGPDAAGLPYLTFFHAGEVTCFRGGKTGEYGYDLLAPRAALPALRARIEEAGRRFGLARATLEDLDQAGLESWFFNVRREGAIPGLTPLELQLQWRISRRKAFVGADAVAARRREGLRGRVAVALSPAPVEEGEAVTLEGAPAGRVLRAGRCAPRGAWVALLLLEPAWASPGVELVATRGAALRTVSPPVLRNRSLFVRPQRHAFATRDRDTFPPLA